MKLDIKHGRQAALAMLATSALASGVLAAGPANAATTHTVTVQANPGTSGLVGGITCDDTVGNGPDYYDSAALSSSGRGTFAGVPENYECYGYVYQNTDFATYYYSDSTTTLIADNNTVLTSTGTARTDYRCTNYSTVTGKLAVDQTVTAVPGPVTGGTTTTLHYAWSRVDYVGGRIVLTPVQSGYSAANSPQYKVTEADFGHQLIVNVDQNDASGAQANDCVGAVSAPIGRVGAPAPRRPVIRGKAIVGHRLGSLGGTPPAGTSVSRYQWYYEKIVKTRKGKKVVFVKIRGAHHTVYRLKGRDRGKLIVVGITYTRPSYNPTVLMSKPKRVK